MSQTEKKNLMSGMLFAVMVSFLVFTLIFLAGQDIEGQSTKIYRAESFGTGGKNTGGTLAKIELSLISDDAVFSFNCVQGKCESIGIVCVFQNGAHYPLFFEKAIANIPMKDVLKSVPHLKVREKCVHLGFQVNVARPDWYIRQTGTVEISYSGLGAASAPAEKKLTPQTPVNPVPAAPAVSIVTSPKKGGVVSINNGTGVYRSGGEPAVIKVNDILADAEISFDCLSGDCLYVSVHGYIQNDRARVDTTDGDLLYSGPMKNLTLYELHKKKAYYHYFKIIVNGRYSGYDKKVASVEVLIKEAKGYYAKFMRNSDGTVTDTKSGLVWQRCSLGQNNDQNCTGKAHINMWSPSIAACQNLSLAGRKWRVPSLTELSTLNDPSAVEMKRYPAVNTELFPSPAAGNNSWNYWSDVKKQWNLDVYYSRNLYAGTTGYIEGNSGYFVRCVSGGASSAMPQQPADVVLSFKNNGNGTVTDLKTGYVWQRCSAGQANDNSCGGTYQRYTHEQAAAYCKNLNLAGRSWELPTSADWEAISYRYRTPSVNTEFFPLPYQDNRRNAAILFWTATVWENDRTMAWNRNVVGSGGTPRSLKSQLCVRCVSKR